MATDCKSVDGSLPWFKSMFHHLTFADLAQPAEHIHGKDGVFGSNPKIGFVNENNSFEVKMLRGFFCCTI